MYCKANFKSVAKCKKRLCTAVFALFKKNTRRVAWPVLQSRCKALSALSQNTLKNTKTGRKSVGFLILTQAPKCTRSHCFPPQKHPKNGFVMRFAGKNSFFQLRARDFSFYMNAYTFRKATVTITKGPPEGSPCEIPVNSSAFVSLFDGLMIARKKHYKQQHFTTFYTKSISNNALSCRRCAEIISFASSSP